MEVTYKGKVVGNITKCLNQFELTIFTKKTHKTSILKAQSLEGAIKESNKIIENLTK
jgi:hypothetical protein